MNKDKNNLNKETAHEIKNSQEKIKKLQEMLNNLKLKEESKTESLKTPEACSINKEGVPETCSIQKEPEVCSIDKDLVYPGTNILRDHIKDEDISKTYGFNIKVSPQKREEILEELSKEQSFTIKNPDLFVSIIENGPYEVHGNIPIKDIAIKTDKEGQSIGWDKEKDLKDKVPVLLCRCGHSKHMPFCDEMHLKIDFDGTLTASNKPYNESANIYKGCQGVYLMDEESLCAIVRFCDPDGSCWNLVKSKATEDIAYDQTCNCASGRLTMIKDGKKLEPDLEQEIECIYDTERDELGPLWLKGGIAVKSKDTDYEIRNRVTLCRCGRSRNKPFCDGMHLTCPKLNEEEIEENE